MKQLGTLNFSSPSKHNSIYKTSRHGFSPTHCFTSSSRHHRVSPPMFRHFSNFRANWEYMNWIWRLLCFSNQFHNSTFWLIEERGNLQNMVCLVIFKEWRFSKKRVSRGKIREFLFTKICKDLGTILQKFLKKLQNLCELWKQKLIVHCICS